MEPQATHTDSTDPSGESQPHRILVLATVEITGKDFSDALRSHVGSDEEVEVFVISPAISHNRIDQELGNIAETLPETEERLNTVIQELNDAGFKARGEVGDLEPLVALGDGLRMHDNVDEIVVIAHDDDEAPAAEDNLWDRIKDEYHQPVTQLKVSTTDGPEPEVVDTKRAPAHEETKEERIRRTRNFPPMTKRDTMGILVGVFGTIALGLIAVAIGTDDDGNLTGDAAAVLLIAIGAFLINVGHVIALLFFESVRYHGIWEKFMARLSLYGTALGLLVALILWLF